MAEHRVEHRVSSICDLAGGAEHVGSNSKDSSRDVHGDRLAAGDPRLRVLAPGALVACAHLGQKTQGGDLLGLRGDLGWLGAMAFEVSGGSWGAA